MQTDPPDARAMLFRQAFETDYTLLFRVGLAIGVSARTLQEAIDTHGQEYAARQMVKALAWKLQQVTIH